MQIGKLFIPDYDFPPNTADDLQSFLSATHEDLPYVVYNGLEKLESTTANAHEIYLLATIKYLEENPENGLAALEIGNAFGYLGEVDKAVAVLKSLEATGCPGIYGDAYWEHPMYFAGWMLVEFGRYEEAISCYKRVLETEIIEEKGPVWAHLATTYHESGDYTQAADAYSKAIQRLNTDQELNKQNSVSDEEFLLIEYLRKLATENVPLSQFSISEFNTFLLERNRKQIIEPETPQVVGRWILGIHITDKR
jgi:tetratricopeptide (TPR) repeat protein